MDKLREEPYMKILVTGGTGFIGSHTCVELIEAGNEVVIIDNLYNSQADVVDKIENITGKRVAFYEADCCDEATLEKIFSEHKIDAAIHFAGYKAVGESVQKPIMYYQNNLMSLLALCKVMGKHNCKRIVFSSSATVYGNPASVPIFEDFPLGPTTNPYGTTKLMIEQILKDLYISDNEWNIALLRYFNPIGAHKSGLLGESPNDIPNNLMPYIVKVANKELPYLHVYGNDYDKKFQKVSSVPKYYYGLQGAVTWKGFDVSMNWQGAAGFSIYWYSVGQNSTSTILGYGLSKELQKDHYFYDPENPNDPRTNLYSKNSRLTLNQTNQATEASTLHLEKGNFLKLRNLTIGYTLPQAWTQKFYANKVRIYFSGENLLTITKFSGMDPEMQTGMGYVTMRQLALGININF